MSHRIEPPSLAHFRANRVVERAQENKNTLQQERV